MLHLELEDAGGAGDGLVIDVDSRLAGFGEFLFYDWIRDGEIELEPNPILVTGPNFGCGSSREHAPWALEDF
ncbi:MAG TPA: hypothetical protein VMS11_13895, partial [Solirubrobacterales bacterium]|nr:hypothetical protein [Solirubrobacterales bacterium]